MTVRVRITGIRAEIDHAVVTGIGHDFAVRLVTDVTRQVLNRGTVLTPVDTGNLRARNKMRVDPGPPGGVVRGQVYNDTRYAEVVHDGTPPYVIRPRRAKALRFTVGGQVVFARSVRHPGSRGRPWLADAAREVAAQRGFLWRPE